jgi:hypothetical protein
MKVIHLKVINPILNAIRFKLNYIHDRQNAIYDECGHDETSDFLAKAAV